MKIVMAAIAALLFTFVSTSAEARHVHRHQHARHVVRQTSDCRQDNNGRTICSSVALSARRTVGVSYGNVRYAGSRPRGCPYRWCGCGVSLKVFGRIIPSLNLAANWLRKFPRAAPAPGMVAARSGHVFYIEQVYDDGTVLAYDPNSGGHVAHEHRRSLRGFRVVNPHGARVASR